MKLYCSPTSPYARKARILVRELNLLGKAVEEVVVIFGHFEEVRRVNPLGKVPALVLDDGSLIVDSPVVCEYLNDLGGGKFFATASIFSHHTNRWRVLTLQALGDGLCDAAALWLGESRRPAERQDPDMLAHHLAAIARTLDALEKTAAKFAEFPTIGEIAVGCALGYLDFRKVGPDWRSGRPMLAAWFEKFAQYPSVIATKPA